MNQNLQMFYTNFKVGERRKPLLGIDLTLLSSVDKTLFQFPVL